MSSSPPPAFEGDMPDRTTAGSAKKARRQRKLRRRVTGALILMLGLVSAGFLASALTPAPQVATASDDSAALIREGKQLYDTSCITCHGANLQGVQDRGPSLIGVGEAAVYFQVSSGRMPAARNEAQASRKPAKFDARQTDAIGAYVQSQGGGPTVIRDENGEIAQSSLRGGDVARGSELFRMNCASCHNFTGRGGALSSGKYAPVLDPASEQQIYAAMVTGPQNMPKFSDRQLTLEEKKDIIAYVKQSSEAKNPGGYGLGGLGPASEGPAMWIIGIVAVVGAALWIGARS
ncbi:c-type cytochrome [Prescottella sp. R16]|uniref:cytochrome bc1 complex diheme cytochrome c subunit n=1 Tax=Prescottella sp. R16 TaxID=3064529 RepID=UPI00272ECEC4|nr:cytochrome c [Prescottella sp. R16]